MAKGGTTLVQAPAPQMIDKHLIINTNVSLISIGTERMLVDFGKASMLQKARQQPDKVREVLNKIETDGSTPIVAIETFYNTNIKANINIISMNELKPESDLLLLLVKHTQFQKINFKNFKYFDPIGMLK